MVTESKTTESKVEPPQEGRASLTTDGCTKSGMSTYVILFFLGLGLIIAISVIACFR